MNTQTNGKVQPKQRKGLGTEGCVSIEVAGKTKHPNKSDWAGTRQNT